MISGIFLYVDINRGSILVPISSGKSIVTLQINLTKRIYNMDNPQIFKLIFKHDLRLKELGKEAAPTARKSEYSLSDFMKPDPTYSQIRFSGTDLEKEHFGLNTLHACSLIIDALEKGFEAASHPFICPAETGSLREFIDSLSYDHAALFERSSTGKTPASVTVQSKNDINLKTLLEKDVLILKKIPAPDGYDLKIYSRHNIYNKLFPGLQRLVPEHYRFFSINGHKFRTERHFYFETWSLHRLPHGFEEVFAHTKI